jgi:hypothetical protein
MKIYSRKEAQKSQKEILFVPSVPFCGQPEIL